MNKGEVKFCPQCGGASVDFSPLAGSVAKCRGCRWEGSLEDLLTVPFSHDYISDDAMLVALMNDLRGMLSGSLGLPYLKFLIKWGFVKADITRVSETLDRKVFSRYLAAIARGVLTALLTERARMSEEDTARTSNQVGAS